MADSYIPSKDKKAVNIVFEDGSSEQGFLFVPNHDRLIDVMNDDRQFLPFESDNGEFIIISKSSIKGISNVNADGGLRLRAK